MRIKELRTSLGISQTKLGEVIGVTRSTVCQYEQGKRQPDNKTLVTLADFFGVSVDYLLGRDCPQEQTEGTVIWTKEEMRHLAKMIADMTDEEVETLSKFVDFIISQRT